MLKSFTAAAVYSQSSTPAPAVFTAEPQPMTSSIQVAGLLVGGIGRTPGKASK